MKWLKLYPRAELVSESQYWDAQSNGLLADLSKQESGPKNFGA